jgi:flagellar biogenesis protein FliO
MPPPACSRRSMPRLLVGWGLLFVLLAGSVRSDELDRPPAQRPRSHPIAPPDRSEGFVPASGGAWWFSLMVIGGALAAFGALSWATRSRNGPRGSIAREFQVLGRLPLGPRHSIYTVRIGARTLLVGTGSQGPPTLLTELDDWLDGSLDEGQKPPTSRPAEWHSPAIRVSSTARPMAPTGGS